MLYTDFAFPRSNCFEHFLTPIDTSLFLSFVHFIIFYGMITSLGMGISMVAYGIALNTYFQEKRSQAVGIYMTITALGPILVPPLQSVLLSTYGVQGTMLILGGLSLHSLVGALLLQPIKWHAKRVETDVENKNCKETNEALLLHIPESKTDKNVMENHTNYNSEEHRRKRTTTISSLDHDAETASIYGYDTPMSTSRRFSTSYYRSMDTVNLGSSMKIFDDDLLHKEDESKCTNLENNLFMEENGRNREQNWEDTTDRVNISENKVQKTSKISKFLHGVVRFFDLDLLRDPLYVNLMLGMSIAILAELNFSLLTPFILADMSLNTNQIALIMSIIGFGDLVFRGVSCFIGKWVKQSFRVMYLYSLTLLIISRSTLIFAESFKTVMPVAICLGIAKGLRSVYMPLVIPDYIKSVDKLASASSIQMLVNGCLLSSAGPLIGFIRDISNSYVPCIGFINAVTMLTIIMWTTEIIIEKVRAKKRM